MQAPMKWIEPDTHMHTDTEANIRELIKEIKVESCTWWWQSAPESSSCSPRMVCLLPWQRPFSDLISLINSIRYSCKYKQCSLHPSSSGQSTLLIYSLLLWWLVFPVVPRIPPFLFAFAFPCYDHLLRWKFNECMCVFVCVCETLCECQSLWRMPNTRGYWDRLIRQK